jgi:hypothetical protein
LKAGAASKSARTRGLGCAPCYGHVEDPVQLPALQLLVGRKRLGARTSSASCFEWAPPLRSGTQTCRRQRSGTCTQAQAVAQRIVREPAEPACGRAEARARTPRQRSPHRKKTPLAPQISAWAQGEQASDGGRCCVRASMQGAGVPPVLLSKHVLKSAHSYGELPWPNRNSSALMSGIITRKSHPTIFAFLFSGNVTRTVTPLSDFG